jgi:hypothetical protein
MSNLFHRISRYAAAPILAGCVLMLAGCPATDVGGSVSQNTQTGATTVTVTVTIHIHAPLKQFGAWLPQVTGMDLAGFDPSQALMNIALSNATIASTSGTVTVTLTDLNTGQVAGQQSFAYVVRGNSLYAQDPTAVSNWLQQFSGLANLDVATNVSTDLAPTAAGSATLNAQYGGVTYSSSTVNFQRPVIGGGGCHTRICPNQ